VSAPRQWVEPWEMRIVARLGLRPLPVGLLLTGSFMAVYVAVESIFGPLLDGRFLPQVFGFSIAAVPLYPARGASGRDRDALEAGIALTRGDSCALPDSSALAEAERHVALSFARIPESRMEEAVEALAAIVRRASGTPRRRRKVA